MRPQPRIVGAAAIILAAGASTRLGHPKQLVVFKAETLLDRAVRIAHEAGCSPVYVVLGASAERIQQHCRLTEATVLINTHWQEGMASSIRLGIAAISNLNLDGALILTCDMPAVTSDHLRALAATETLTASRYANRNGVPAFFPAALLPDLLALQGDQGARTILAHAPYLDLANGDLDLDTPEDLAVLRSLA